MKFPDISTQLETEVGFKLNMDQIKAMVRMGESPTSQDIMKIKAWVGGAGVGEEDVGPTTTKILDFIKNYRREGDTLFFNSSMIQRL